MIDWSVRDLLGAMPRGVVASVGDTSGVGSGHLLMKPQIILVYHFCWLILIRENPIESFKNSKLPIVDTNAWMKVILRYIV
jgi:hypothetical protein